MHFKESAGTFVELDNRLKALQETTVKKRFNCCRRSQRWIYVFFVLVAT